MTFWRSFIDSDIPSLVQPLGLSPPFQVLYNKAMQNSSAEHVLHFLWEKANVLPSSTISAMTATIPANLSISIPTLTGSLLSCVASFFALCLHAIVPPPRRHFRHALIVNLLVAGRSIQSISPHMGLPNPINKTSSIASTIQYPVSSPLRMAMRTRKPPRALVASPMPGLVNSRCRRSTSTFLSFLFRYF